LAVCIQITSLHLELNKEIKQKINQLIAPLVSVTILDQVYYPRYGWAMTHDSSVT
jgi:hypothetical protein